MKLNLTHTGATLLATIAGAMDAIGVARDRDAASRLLDAANGSVLVDMTDVSFMDASGLGFITHIVKRAQAAGTTVKLTNVAGQPANFLKNLGLYKRLCVTDREILGSNIRANDAFVAAAQAA